MDKLGPITIRIIGVQQDPRDPKARLAIEGRDDAGNIVRHRTVRRLLRRIIKNPPKSS